MYNVFFCWQNWMECWTRSVKNRYAALNGYSKFRTLVVISLLIALAVGKSCPWGHSKRWKATPQVISASFFITEPTVPPINQVIFVQNLPKTSFTHTSWTIGASASLPGRSLLSPWPSVAHRDAWVACVGWLGRSAHRGQVGLTYGQNQKRSIGRPWSWASFDRKTYCGWT